MLTLSGVSNRSIRVQPRSEERSARAAAVRFDCKRRWPRSFKVRLPRAERAESLWRSNAFAFERGCLPCQGSAIGASEFNRDRKRDRHAQRRFGSTASGDGRAASIRFGCPERSGPNLSEEATRSPLNEDAYPVRGQQSEHPSSTAIGREIGTRSGGSVRLQAEMAAQLQGSEELNSVSS